MPKRHDHTHHGDDVRASDRARRDGSDRPHDVLAAEEFAVGAPDPALHQEPVHDVLAAEEFAVGAPDPALHPHIVVIPAEPGAGPAPHDVLAADEFAVPAGRPVAPEPAAGSPARGRLIAGVAIAVLATLRWRRRR
jgi:hypothetical protein